MSSQLTRKSVRVACAGTMALLALVSICRAQITNQNQTAMGAGTDPTQDQLWVGAMGLQPEKEQASAYQAFLKERDPAKKVRLGNSFLEKYPKSPLAEQIDAGMMNVYRAQQDWKNTYLCADHALALQPDDVDVLATVGWTIPHVYSPEDPDADQELSKAETYAKHAIDVLSKMPKPSRMNDAQFQAAKARRSFQAHSALGLVYFRRDDYDNSAKELRQATKDNPTPDATDLFVLGVDLQNLNRSGEAAEAFRACGQMAGPLQDRCKQGADSTKADPSKSK